MGELWFRVKEFFGFSRREKQDLLLAVIVLGFAFGFNDGRDSFVLGAWLGHLVTSLAFVAIAMIVHVSVQKIFALQQGFTSEFRGWPTGLIVTIIIVLLSKGNLYVLLPGGMVLYHMTILRIGKFRHGENVVARGMIAASGPAANLVLGTIGVMFASQLGIMPEFFGYFRNVNFWIMLYSLLPIPRMDGIHLFFMSRLTYVFIFSTGLAYFLLLLVNVESWILSLLIGVICWFLFMIYVEKNV
ncbi:MAG: hypothetical protein ACOCZ6_05700 [Nanoarchaeota archaeon]